MPQSVTVAYIYIGLITWEFLPSHLIMCVVLENTSSTSKNIVMPSVRYLDCHVYKYVVKIYTFLVVKILNSYCNMQTKEVFTFLKLSTRRVIVLCSKTQGSVSTHFSFVFWISQLHFFVPLRIISGFMPHTDPRIHSAWLGNAKSIGSPYVDEGKLRAFLRKPLCKEKQGNRLTWAEIN